MALLFMYLFFSWQQGEAKNELHGGIPAGSKVHSKIREVVPFIEDQTINCFDSENRRQGLWIELRTDTIRLENTVHSNITFIHTDSVTGVTRDSVITVTWESAIQYDENSIFLDGGGSPHYDFHIVNDSMRIKYTIHEYGYYEKDLRSGLWVNLSGCYKQHIHYSKGIVKGDFTQFNAEGAIMYEGVIDPKKQEQEITGFIKNGADDTLVHWIPTCIPVTY